MGQLRREIATNVVPLIDKVGEWIVTDGEYGPEPVLKEYRNAVDFVIGRPAPDDRPRSLLQRADAMTDALSLFRDKLEQANHWTAECREAWDRAFAYPYDWGSFIPASRGGPRYIQPPPFGKPPPTY